MNPSGKCSQERLTRGTVTSTMRRAAHPSGRARCGAGAGCSAIKYQSLWGVGCDGALSPLLGLLLGLLGFWFWFWNLGFGFWVLGFGFWVHYIGGNLFVGGSEFRV